MPRRWAAKYADSSLIRKDPASIHCWQNIYKELETIKICARSLHSHKWRQAIEGRLADFIKIVALYVSRMSQWIKSQTHISMLADGGVSDGQGSEFLKYPNAQVPWAGLVETGANDNMEKNLRSTTWKKLRDRSLESKMKEYSIRLQELLTEYAGLLSCWRFQQKGC